MNPVIDSIFLESLKYMFVAIILIVISIIVKSIIVADEIRSSTMNVVARFINRKEPISEVRVKKRIAHNIMQDFEVMTHQGHYYRVIIFLNLSRFMKIRPVTKFGYKEISSYNLVVKNSSNDGVYHIQTVAIK